MALVVSVVFSMVPAIQLLKPDIVNSLKEQTSTATGGALSFRRLVVSLQVGLSVLLLAGAGLFVRTMENLRRVDTGFNTSYLVTFHIDPQLSGYAAEKIPALQKQVLETMATLPGVQAVGATDDQELADNNHGINVTVEGYTAPADEDFDVEAPSVNAGTSMRCRCRWWQGVAFSDDDDLTHPPVVVVNETFVKHYFSESGGSDWAEGGAWVAGIIWST